MVIFEKIIEAIKRIFHRPKAIDAPKQEESKTIASKNIDAKEKFFELYNKALSGEIDWSEISYEDAIRINSMLDQEISIRSKNIHKLRDENKLLKYDIMNKNAEIERLKKQLNAS